jgi:hypothetical protein
VWQGRQRAPLFLCFGIFGVSQGTVATLPSARCSRSGTPDRKDSATSCCEEARRERSLDVFVRPLALDWIMFRRLLNILY